MALKAVTIPRGYQGIHCEISGCIVNIREGLTDKQGRAVTSVEILCDDYAGEATWKINGRKRYANVRVIRLKGKRIKR